ncbi:15052_t:CDS:2 [Funneliformis geosporum]|nr:15052_t:CDS:2 [Funneliformis geosporum]
MQRYFLTTEKESSSSKKHEVKRRKYRNNPDPKWMDNGNNAWLEYRDINGIIHMFCKWCEAKKYTNELAKGTINYRKQSIDRHLTHHEHKAEAEARKPYQSNLLIGFSRQLDADKIKIVSQMQFTTMWEVIILQQTSASLLVVISY